jgi:hypothetical protein
LMYILLIKRDGWQNILPELKALVQITVVSKQVMAEQVIWINDH